MRSVRAPVVAPISTVQKHKFTTCKMKLGGSAFLVCSECQMTSDTFMPPLLKTGNKKFRALLINTQTHTQRTHLLASKECFRKNNNMSFPSTHRPGSDQ